MSLLLTDSDREQLLKWTLGEGASIVVSKFYKVPRYLVVDSSAHLGKVMSENQLFVVHPDWQLEDLVMSSVVNKHEGPVFYIAQRYGGPAIDYLLYPERVEGEKVILGRGSVHHYPHYYSARDAGEVLPVPPAMREFYSRLARFLKKDAVRLKGEIQSVWLSRSTAEQVAAGTKFVPEEWEEAARKVFGSVH